MPSLPQRIPTSEPSSQNIFRLQLDELYRIREAVERIAESYSYDDDSLDDEDLMPEEPPQFNPGDVVGYGHGHYVVSNNQLQPGLVGIYDGSGNYTNYINPKDLTLVKKAQPEPPKTIRMEVPVEDEGCVRNILNELAAGRRNYAATTAVLGAMISASPFI